MTSGDGTMQGRIQLKIEPRVFPGPNEELRAHRRKTLSGEHNEDTTERSDYVTLDLQM